MSRDALVVGINKYPFFKDSSTGNYKHLTTPASDAEAIAQLLEAQNNFQVKRFPASIIDGKLQVDPNPDKPFKNEELEKAIFDLFLPETGKPPETALLFFTGHGMRKQLRQNFTQVFLAASDSCPSKNQYGFPLRDLWDILQKSQVKQQIIWLDCCFSGELLNFKDTELGRQSSGCDRFLIAASRNYEVAYQLLDGKHGVLSSALLAGLDPYQIKENEWVTNRTLAVSVEQKLQAYCEQTKITQTPLISNHGEVINLVQGKAKPNKEVVGNSSNKQLHIVLHWLIRLLEDDAIESIQLESTVMPGEKSSIIPDKIVAFYKDGHPYSIQTQKFEDWEHQNQLDLERIVPKANLAMLVLERYIQSNNTHLRDTKWGITRSDVLAELDKHELNPTPKRTEEEILANFQRASSIGRYWLRKIDGKAIPRSELPKIIELIEQGSRTILLIDRPGSGKTCILLDLADYIEREKTLVWGLLFIKGDQFTKLSSEQELTVNGLPENIVGQCARLADHRQVVVIIDSLDVLSLSRQQGPLKVFLGIIDRLEKLDGVTLIVACRNFDFEYDPLLRGRSWQHKVNLQLLDFDNEVKPFLIDWIVDISNITPELRALLQIPQNLWIYERLAKLGVSLQPASAYELYNSFLEEVVVKKPTLGTEAVVALQNMAEQLMQQRTQSYSKVSFGTSEDIVRQLISQEVLLETSPGCLIFSHQTLAECLIVRATRAKNQTLAQFILEHPQLPFIRPAVRAFFFYLRADQPDIFRKQVWKVLSNDEIAYHVKRLVTESFAEIIPVEDDWRLLRRIFQKYPDLFRRLLWRANSGAWWNTITYYWLPEAQLSRERETWLLQFIQWLGVWMNVYPAEVVAFCREAIAQKWASPQNLAGSILYILTDFKVWGTEGIQELLETFVEDYEIEQDDIILGKLLSRWVQSTNGGDILLWRYITKNILPEDVGRWDLRDKLHCSPDNFYQENFLADRLCQSDTLLNLVLDELESWNVSSGAIYGKDGLQCQFLRDTSWEQKHTQHDIHPINDLTILLDGLENAIKHRVRKNDIWWLENEPRLRNSPELAIRYFVIEAYKENICYSHSIKFWILVLDIDCLAGTLFLYKFFQAYLPGIESLLRDSELFRHSDLSYELGELMQMAYPKISESAQQANQSIILYLCSENKEYEEEFSFRAYRDLLLWIPCIFRTADTQNFMESWQDYFSYSRPELNIYSWGGALMPPLSPQNLLKLSDNTLFRLLHYYSRRPTYELFDENRVGGLSEVKSVLRDACSLYPTRFITLITLFLEDNLSQSYLCVVVEGIANHLRYRFSNVRPGQLWKPIEPLPEGETIAATLLNWLERYFIIWEDGRTVSQALEACCDILVDSKSAERLSLLLFWLYTKYPNDRQIDKNSENLINTGINSIHGVAAESTITLYNRLLEHEQPIPEMLLLLLRNAARDTAIYVRVPVLQHLPFLIYKNPDLGWQLLADVFQEPQPHLWKYAEQCFYYQYRDKFDKVAPYLNRLLHEGLEEGGETWGRISGLASLAGHISQEKLFGTLETTNNIGAWNGTTQVFTANLNLKEHSAKCISGLIRILHHGNLPSEIIRKIDRCFNEENKRNFIRYDLAIAFLEALPASARGSDFHGFLEWLACESRRTPIDMLKLIEILAEKLETTMNANQFWHTEPLIVALNEILREADETDNPKLIQRSIKIQDSFLRLNIRGMEELLNQAGQA